jgi:Helix-turn-helix domain
MNTLVTLQKLFFSEEKPEDLTPLDICLVAYLLLRQTETHHIYDSQETLARRVGCGRVAVAKSLRRLESLGWITIKNRNEFNPKTKRRGIDKTAGLSVNADKLPSKGSNHSKPSPEAKELSARYVAALRNKGCKLDRNFAGRQEHSAQRLFELLGHDWELVRAIVNYAFKTEKFKKTVFDSLYKVQLRLKTIRRAYEKELVMAAKAA